MSQGQPTSDHVQAYEPHSTHHRSPSPRSEVCSVERQDHARDRLGAKDGFRARTNRHGGVVSLESTLDSESQVGRIPVVLHTELRELGGLGRGRPSGRKASNSPGCVPFRLLSRTCLTVEILLIDHPSWPGQALPRASIIGFSDNIFSLPYLAFSCNRSFGLCSQRRASKLY